MKFKKNLATSPFGTAQKYQKKMLWYRCYYQHWSRELVSPVCGTFTSMFSSS